MIISNNRKWFTIVELVVVISILSVLSTIGFLAYSWYLITARDTNRTSQLWSLSEWLNILRTKGRLPFPENKVIIYSGTDIVSYQWYIWESVLSTMRYSNTWIDPKDNINFSYYLTANRKYFQLMWFLEEEYEEREVVWIINQSYATDYSIRFPYVKWSNLWILVTEENIPIPKYLSSVGLTEIDISDVDLLNLKSYLTTTSFVEWNGTTFSELPSVAKKWWRYYSVESNAFVYDEPVY